MLQMNRAVNKQNEMFPADVFIRFECAVLVSGCYVMICQCLNVGNGPVLGRNIGKTDFWLFKLAVCTFV